MRIRHLVAGGVVVAVVGGGYAAYAAQAGAPSYRTATASVGDVEQTLNLSGTLEPAGRADLAFATSGTVEAVDVAPGDTVETGAVLGSLDDTTLRKQVQQARATLAAARAQLESDRDAQASSVTPTSTSSASTSDATPIAYVRAASDPAPEPDSELAELQQAVIDAQSVVSDALAAAAEALAAQQAACTAETVADPACTDALVAVQTAQQQVSDDQAGLQAAIDALAGYLQEAGQPEQPQPGQPEPPQPEQPAPSQPPQVEQPEAAAPSVSAATLARDQAAIDQAEADLLSARQELRMATVTAPFAGEVVEVDVAVGDSVPSGTDVFVLVARGTTTVEVDATSTQLRQLEVGQVATVTPVGSDRELTGEVTRISSIPDDSSSYPVTITLARKGLDLATGLTASVAVVTGHAADVVTVPASAVADGVVQVLEDGEVSRVPVTTGVTGETRVAVTEGLAEGDVVVLADLDRPIPSSDLETGGDGEVRLPGGGGGPVFIRRGGP